MNTATLNTYTSSNRVNTLIEALHSNLGTLTRETGNATDSNQAICNLRNLSLQQALQEDWRCTAQDNLRIVVIVVNTKDDGTYSLALTIHITRNLLRLRQHLLVVLVINDKNLALPYLINLTRDYLSNTVFIFIVE